jgi:uridine kinase
MAADPTVTPRRVSQRELTELVRDAVADRPNRTVWIGIDGFGGAGKTRLAEALASSIGDAPVVHVDDFAGPAVPEWDWPRFVTQVRDPLEAGRSGRYQRWNWDRDEPGDWREVPAAVPVVVEGVSCTRREVGIAWDVQVWVDTPRQVRLDRALRRDGPDMLARWLTDWMPSEERYAAREHPQERADWIVSGTEDSQQ